MRWLSGEKIGATVLGSAALCSHIVSSRCVTRSSSRIVGDALFWLAPAVDPYLTGSILRRGAGLMTLVGAGAAVYAIACFLTGAFVLNDVKLLINRRAREV